MSETSSAPSPRVLLYGAGSVGGVYLYQLLQAGCHVTAVCRSNYETVLTNGFCLESVRYGNVTFRPSAITKTLDEVKSQSFDFLLVCTKSFPGLAAQLWPVLANNPNTAIVLAQNGVLIEEELSRAFPSNPLISGVIYCPAVQTAPGEINYPEMLNLLELGTYPASAPEQHKDAARRFADLMIKGGGGATVHDDVQIPRWKKLLMNAAWNPIGALTLTSDGDFMRTSECAEKLALGVMLEIVALAKAVGVNGLTAEVAEEQLAHARRRAETGSGREVSMLQDVRQGRPFEVEAIVGNPLRLGKEKGLDMPRLETLYALAKARSWVIEREREAKA